MGYQLYNTSFLCFVLEGVLYGELLFFFSKGDVRQKLSLALRLCLLSCEMSKLAHKGCCMYDEIRLLLIDFHSEMILMLA